MLWENSMDKESKCSFVLIECNPLGLLTTFPTSPTLFLKYYHETNTIRKYSSSLFFSVFMCKLNLLQAWGTWTVYLLLTGNKIELSCFAVDLVESGVMEVQIVGFIHHGICEKN